MKTMSLTTFVVCILSFLSLATNRVESYEKAEIYCLSIQGEFDEIASTYDLDYRNIIPIIFPECTRVNEFSDQMETTALEYFYVNYGSDGADFSIGNFQMKPSFIEDLEQYIPSLDFSEIQKNQFNFLAKTTKEKRAERVARLSDITWQIHYLCLFYKVMDHRFPEIIWQNNQERLSFYAAAYNYGFLSTEKVIRNWESKSQFGIDEFGNAVSYSNVALDYYLKIKGHE